MSQNSAVAMPPLPPLSLDEIRSWDVEAVCRWLVCQGLGAMENIFRMHGVLGQDLLLLEKEDLRYMQAPVGHSLRLMSLLASVKAEAARQAVLNGKNKVLGKWLANKGWCDFGCFKDEYTLTGARLTITYRNCYSSKNDNIDLSNVRDVDLSSSCCFSTIRLIDSSSGGGPKLLYLASDVAPTVQRMIQDNMEMDQATHRR